MQLPLLFVTILPDPLVQAINYPGEARYLALMPGPGNAIWYDDGTYTGLARVSFPDFLALAHIATYATLFHSRSNAPMCWFLFDRRHQALFIGTIDLVERSLQRNTYPIPHHPQ